LCTSRATSGGRHCAGLKLRQSGMERRELGAASARALLQRVYKAQACV